MSIEEISSDSDYAEMFSISEEVGKWNYHEVREDGEKCHAAILQTLSTKQEGRVTLAHRTIKPLMSGGGRVSGEAGYSEKEGWKAEIKIEIDLGTKSSDSDKKEGSSDNSGNTGSSDVDSGDRDIPLVIRKSVLAASDSH